GEAAGEVEDVAVDDARPVAKGRPSTPGALDALQGREQPPGRSREADARDEVPEPGLRGVADGRGRVEGGNAVDRGDAGDATEGRSQVGAPVAEVRAEADVGLRTLPRPPAPSGRAPALRRPRPLRPRPRLPPRRAAPHRTRASRPESAPSGSGGAAGAAPEAAR